MRIRLTSVLAVCCLLLACAAPVACGEGAGGGKAERPNYQIRGFSMQLNNSRGMQDYLQAIDDLAAMGCTSINFVIAARQHDVKSATLAINWQNLPPAYDIERILKHAKEKGFYTILMPIVLLDTAGSKEWRGVIAPPDWENWFFSYRLYIKQMATMAAKCEVDLFCVGSELLSTEAMRAEWLMVIKEVKGAYKGKLTYSANWDHYEVPSFWDQLDYIGMNNYNELADKPGATVAQLNKNWAPIKSKILEFVKKEKKPFLFTEVGWHNLQNTIAQPWNYVADGPIDFKEQERAYESFVETWKDVPTSQFMGALIWEWTPYQKGTDHGAYMLSGTPAMEVVKKWMGGSKGNG